MDYWISSNNVQMGPYSLQQLQHLWKQGQVTSDTCYFDNVRSEWLLLKTLIESNRELFTVEEAFVRLGQNRQNGCLSVYNNVEILHLFVDSGFVIYAASDKERGEFALARALRLEDATYEWLADAKPPATNLRLNIAEYALKNAIARDVRIGSAATRKQNTVALPRMVGDKVEVKPKFNYVLIPDEAPALIIKLTKMNNVVGREVHCDVVVDDRQVSRKHCLLELWDQHIKVKDLDSSNGTFVNGIAVRDGFLRVGDELRLGTYKLMLQKEQRLAPETA